MNEIIDGRGWWIPFHFGKGFLGHGEDVRIQITEMILIPISVNNVLSVNRQVEIRIDGNQHNT